MKFAVIKTGGKQYIAQEAEKLKVEKIIGEEGQEIEFDQVLLVSDGKKIELGQPYLENKTVKAKILKQSRAKKITVIKYKPKTRYRKKTGHRQSYTEVEILKI